MDTDDQSYNLDELADKSGFDKRVIRSFIEQGLLPGPDSMGRYARYSPSHLMRLLAIKELKDGRGLQLSEVRRALITLGVDDISALAKSQSAAAQSPPSSALDYIRSIKSQQQHAPLPGPSTYGNGRVPPPLPSGVPVAGDPDGNPPGSPSTPIQGSANRSTSGSTSSTSTVGAANTNACQSPDSLTTTGGRTAVDQLLQGVSQLTQGIRVRKQARGETWFRIPITPDIELTVRGIQEPEQLNRLERIADHLRELLLRGNHE